LTLKDIANIKSNLRKEVDRKSLEDVIHFLRNKGSLAEVIVDENKNFKGLFYQDAYMQNIFKHFPELILVDATYKLLDLRMPVYVIMCVDGNGLSEIVAVFIVAEETTQVIESAVQIFKKHNSSWCAIKVVMSDKDFTERDAFVKCFPDATLNICLYHTLRSFSREVTCEKMGITNAERLRILEILSALAHAKSPDEYDTNLQVLKNTKIKSVVDYFLKSWHPIRDQWVSFFKDLHMNLGETTNNRLESTFSKIKSVCHKYASLVQFFSEFHAVLECLRNERNHTFVMALARKATEIENLDNDLKRYSTFLTPYAFEFVREQFMSAQHVKVIEQAGNNFKLTASKRSDPLAHRTTPTTCDCSFFSRMKLPCKHVFKACALSNSPLFNTSLCNSRWTMEHYRSLDRFPQPLFTEVNVASESETDVNVNISTVPDNCKNDKVLTQAQKFRRALIIAQTLASLTSEGGMKTFNQRRSVLESIVNSWKHGREVTVFDNEDMHIDDNVIDECEGKQSSELIFDEDVPIVKSEKPIHEHTKKDEPHPNDNPQSPKSEIAEIKMPPKTLKRGRPKGAEVTVIGLPKTKIKKRHNHLTPFSKLSPSAKDRQILSFVTSEVAAAESLAGKRLLKEEDLLSLHEISDAIKDNENIDINRIQRYFTTDGWLHVLKMKAMKNDTSFYCLTCSKGINDSTQDSIACDRCLLWSHFKCTNLKQKPKKSHWYCTSCKAKFA